MDNLQLVQVIDTVDNLVKKSTCLSLCQSLLLSRVLFLISDVIEQFTATAVLHDQKQVFWGLDYFVELNQVRMTDQFQNVDLPAHSFNVTDVRDLLLLQYLYCHLLLRQFMDCQFYLAEGSLPQCLFYLSTKNTENVMTNALLGLWIQNFWFLCLGDRH